MEQSEFAQRLRITRSRLSSYEYAKAPIKYKLGKEVCYRFGVSQKWLATGDQPKGPYFDLSPNLEFQILPKSLFSAAFDTFLRKHIEEREGELKELYGKEVFLMGDTPGEALDNFHLVGDNPAKAAAFYVRKAVLLRLQWLPPDLQIEYANSIIEADAKFQKKFGRRIATLLPPARRKEAEDSESPAKQTLTHVTASGNTSDVKAQWPLLKRRLQTVTSLTGNKSRLAEFLGVKLSNVSQWLTDHESAREPGAETALRMLKWVEQQERK